MIHIHYCSRGSCMTRQISQYPLVAIVAMAENRVIGDGQQLLWHIPGDLPRVKS